MNRYLAHVITNKDLFCNFDVKKVKGKGNIKRIYKCEDKKQLTEKIFLRYFYMLILYMIEGNRTFVFPYKKFVSLHFRVVPERRIKLLLQDGYLKDIDFLASNFKMYELVIGYYFRNMVIHQYVKLSPNFLQLLHEKINTGHIYA
jgi:hypothetical protein